MNEMWNYKTFLAEPSREKLLPDPVKLPFLQPPYTILLEITDVLVHPEWTVRARLFSNFILPYLLLYQMIHLFEVSDRVAVP